MEERYTGSQTILNIKYGLQDVEDVGEGLAQHKAGTEGAVGPAGHRPMAWPGAYEAEAVMAACHRLHCAFLPAEPTLERHNYVRRAPSPQTGSQRVCMMWEVWGGGR